MKMAHSLDFDVPACNEQVTTRIFSLFYFKNRCYLLNISVIRVAYFIQAGLREIQPAVGNGHDTSVERVVSSSQTSSEGRASHPAHILSSQ